MVGEAKKDCGMKTVTELLTEMAEAIKRDASELLVKHSRLNQREPSPIVLELGGDHRWQSLSVAGSRIQSKLRDDYERLHDLLHCMLRLQAKAVHNDLRQSYAAILKLIDQQHGTFISSGGEAYQQFEETIDKQVRVLATLYDGTEGHHVYVPDTNALIYSSCQFYAGFQAVRPADSGLGWPPLSLRKRDKVHQPVNTQPVGLGVAQRRTG